MLKRSCDRCGKVFEADGGYHFVSSKNGRGTTIDREKLSIDLCDECHIALMDWYRNPTADAIEDIFREPTTVGDEER